MFVCAVKITGFDRHFVGGYTNQPISHILGVFYFCTISEEIIEIVSFSYIAYNCVLMFVCVIFANYNYTDTMI